MRVGQFFLRVLEGRERSTAHVELPSGKQYSLQLSNNHWNRRCDVEVRIDGKNVGTFRIGASSSVTLERGVNDTGRFTFFSLPAATEHGLEPETVAKDDRGLIIATFMPEKPPKVQKVESCTLRSEEGLDFDGGVGGSTMRSKSIEMNALPRSGITGLTGRSQQEFSTVAPLDYDYDDIVVITLRLISAEDLNKPRKLVAASKANAVPEPVE